MASASALDQPFTVLVTGANSGVGQAVCIRLIDEFLSTRPPTPRLSPKAHTLKIIFTVRSPSKAEETLVRLRRHRDQCVRDWVRKGHGSDELAPDLRVSFEAQLADLMNLISVRKLARTVQETNSRLDAVVCNAGIANLGGVDWLAAIKDILRRPKHSLTFPIFMKQSRGQLAPRQLPQIEGKERPEEPPLGEVFTSNLFGHYLLVHGLSGLLSARGGKETPLPPARVIWTSSIEAFAHTLNTQDIQGLQGVASYGSSKRLTDLLVLTSEMPSTTRYVNAFLSPSSSSTPSEPSPWSPTIKPKLYVSHPGVCNTAIASLPLILLYAKLLSFWIARWLGSPWHTITPYKGACAPVWLVLAPQNTIEGIEGTYGKGKWGSATDRLGGESVVKTEVEGWGMGGKLKGEEGCEPIRREGRWIGAKEVTKESREEFEAQGRECWKEMEQLREEWERILNGYEERL